MAQSTVRFAAGAGVVAASLLIVGPNPAQAVADKDGSGSYSWNDDRRSGSFGQDRTPGRSVSGVVNDALNIGGSGNGPNLDFEPPRMDFGTGGSDVEDLAVVDSFGSDGQVAMRSAAVAEAPVGINATGAIPRSGSDYSGSPTAALQSPRVVVGNGRTPGTNVPEPGPASGTVSLSAGEIVAAPEAVPPAPTAIEINFPPLPPPLPPVEKMRPADLVGGQYGMGTTDTVTDPLAGVAGLILIPAIGAVLGFRQARAAQSLRESTRT